MLMATAVLKRSKKPVKFQPNQLPLFKPEVRWRPPDPSTWPDLSGAEYIGVDTETYDPNLDKLGPGFLRGDAQVIGISLATELGHKLYLPIGHVEGNLDKAQVVHYVKEQLSRPTQAKCGANLTYDLESLDSLGIQIKGKLCDIQIAEPLLDEDRLGGYTLEALSKAYLGEGKDETVLRQAAADYSLDPKKHMKFLPSYYVGEYAEVDADNSLRIFLEQEQALKADDCWEIFELEQQLQPIMWKMRKKGVRVDLDKAEQLVKFAKKDEEKLYKEICDKAGFLINISSPIHLSRFFKSEGVAIQLTKLGNVSITSEWLEQQTHPACKLINKLRKTSKMRRDFLEGVILNENVRGRLHPNWHQLRRSKSEDDSDDSETQGTRSGRIACSDPNLTQIPSRDEFWGPAIRKAFIPDEGERWGKLDFSSQEPRNLLHFAYKLKLPGAAEMRQRFINNPKTDYHLATVDIIEERIGQRIQRRQAKDIGLGRSYGMGEKKLARKLGISVEKAIEIIQNYDNGVPYVKKLDEKCKERVEERGFIVTILGRKRRFNLWEKKFSFGQGLLPTDYETAVHAWGAGQIQRAGLNKVLNALVQGSAGDQTKKSIILMDEENITPLIQVYDEIDLSFSDPWQLKRTQEIMEHAIDFSIPMDASPDSGPSWGEVEPHDFN